MSKRQKQKRPTTTAGPYPYPPEAQAAAIDAACRLFLHGFDPAVRAEPHKLLVHAQMIGWAAQRLLSSMRGPIDQRLEQQLLQIEPHPR